MSTIRFDDSWSRALNLRSRVFSWRSQSLAGVPLRFWMRVVLNSFLRFSDF